MSAEIGSKDKARSWGKEVGEGYLCVPLKIRTIREEKMKQVICSRLGMRQDWICREGRRGEDLQLAQCFPEWNAMQKSFRTSELC